VSECATVSIGAVGITLSYEVYKILPRIPDEHLQSVVFMYPSDDAAREGKQVGGSGFVVSSLAGVGDWRIRYVVTNSHVVDGGGHWARLNRFGGMHVVHIPPDDWYHGGLDDFAFAVLRLPEHVKPFELTLDTLALTRQKARELNVGPGDEAYMVGRFIAHGGRVTNNPIARFGSISLMPNPNELVRDGRDKDVEAYLIEMRSHAGFSGSPVFLLIPQRSFRGVIGDASLEDIVTKFRLLGIDTGHKANALPVKQLNAFGSWETSKDIWVDHPTDVAIVCPIWKIVDLLHREDIAEERRKFGLELAALYGHGRIV
jgi:hypothetical protein